MSAPDAATRRQATVTRNGRTIGMVWQRELIRLRRTPTRIVTGLAQPIIFLFILGAGLGSLIQQGPGGLDYQEFLFPGILSMSIITSALFSAVSIVWDREFGFMREMLVAPVSRASIVLGKALGGGTVAVVQGLILVFAAPIVGVDLTVGRLLLLIVSLLLLAFAMTAFGIVLATRIERMESFQMVMTLVLQPMIFLSGAVFPLQNLPTWLAVITHLNPATYAVDLVRRSVLPDVPGVEIAGWVVPMWAEAALVLSIGTGLLALAVRLFNRTE
jgi:ABC-2 type transport system permease protein